MKRHYRKRPIDKQLWIYENIILGEFLVILYNLVFYIVLLNT